MSEQLKALGERIREARKRQGITQLDLAEKVQISASYMSDIEMGKTNFGVETLIFKSRKQKIADAAVALRHYEIASESVELLRKTVYPKTFFGRCDDVAFEEERMTGRPSKFKKDTALQTKLQMEFLDRAIATGKKDLLRKEMPKYVGRLTTEALAYYRGLGL